MGAGHSHDHCHHSGESTTSRLWWIFLLNLTYLVAEVVGGLYSGSLALLADAGHMAIDAAAVALGIFAIWIGTRPRNDSKTYGYHRAEILAALMNGVVLGGTAIWIFVESARRLFHEAPIAGEAMTWVAAGGLVVNLIALALLAAKRGENLNVKGVWLHVLTDTLGSVATVIAAVAVWRFGWNWVDPIVSLGISFFILVGVWKLLLSCVNVLLEAVPEGMNVPSIKRDLESIPGVLGVHDLHVWSVKSGVPALSAHVRIGEGFASGKILKELTNRLEAGHEIHHVTIQIEPPEFTHPNDLECFQ